ncbi:hypothetical protein [Acidithiobacillus sp.]|jgi:hypothetical protein|uniref:hypothetical protein n=1 Tax=Acidithiobacillus sp. TaxID=1872118 RepID=UPI0025BE2685|nr:hypothetical protein [Acidithiobacillus sp.]MCK9187851.1 hypothetical protein [Acidithiobacillus sp.]MCK9358741.1 hypothetical protein [Acidithiobacillus sp.]
MDKGVWRDTSATERTTLKEALNRYAEGKSANTIGLHPALAAEQVLAALPRRLDGKVWTYT